MLVASAHASLPMTVSLQGAGASSAEALVSRAGEPAGEATFDEELVSRALLGEREAEGMLYRRHVQYVHRLVLRILGNREAAQDVVQDTFIIALEQLRCLRNPAAFRGWLAQIAVSQARRCLRKWKLMRLLGLRGGDDAAAIDLAEGPGSSESARIDMAALRQTLVRLPINERLAWSLRHLAGHSLEEAAASCGCSLATVKRRLVAAEAFIQKEFGDRRPRDPA